MKTCKTDPSRWHRFLNGVAAFAVASVAALSLSGCGGGSSDPAPPPVTIAAPGAPTGLTVTGGENVATLVWSPPAVSASTGLPDSFEIYRSTTATTIPATLVAPANFVASVPAVAAQTTPYSYTDIGLPGSNTTYYYVVTARNGGGETPSAVASDSVTGPPNPRIYGNNFSAALIFADDIGISNLALDPAKSWTISDLTAIDYNTGLRPLATEVTAMQALPVPQTTLPYLPQPSRINPLYYEQKSINTWQGEWARANGVDQEVNAKWGDNLSSASLSSSAKIRIEMVLTKDVTATPMTVYPMLLLSGSGTTELQGTTGVATPTTTAFVFATNARLTLQRLDAGGLPTGPMVVDQALFDPAIPDGLNKLSGEIPVSGNFTYGFVWDPATSGSTAGQYRVTFKLDPTSSFGTGAPANNTFMKTATNGVRVSDTEVYIDIDVK
ncbi:MAG: fibronectin type III domain-containing protein [Hydrogenophaga sp.]|uniref:fibronectin type III domain-containing protein n=1 Tax=Hydrogenophaga sp. TaxID=1904254 RepID=UPI002620A027|nr:fibronectin type III domain-containing protein [Hydrogenophaga sp.]MDM7944606.1 fibronectin type III domain-containing protein [Hydrogenophaga sp.]